MFKIARSSAQEDCAFSATGDASIVHRRTGHDIIIRCEPTTDVHIFHFNLPTPASAVDNLSFVFVSHLRLLKNFVSYLLRH